MFLVYNTAKLLYVAPAKVAVLPHSLCFVTNI